MTAKNFSITDREEFSNTTKRAALLRCGCHCETPSCGISLFSAPIEFDHRIPCFFKGTNALANCVVLCEECHTEKTKRDCHQIAKAKRIMAADGLRKAKPKSVMKQKRGFRGWRTFSGDIVRVSADGTKHRKNRRAEPVSG